jgi:hypothetical protein
MKYSGDSYLRKPCMLLFWLVFNKTEPSTEVIYRRTRHDRTWWSKNYRERGQRLYYNTILSFVGKTGKLNDNPRSD